MAQYEVMEFRLCCVRGMKFILPCVWLLIGAWQTPRAGFHTWLPRQLIFCNINTYYSAIQTVDILQYKHLLFCNTNS